MKEQEGAGLTGSPDEVLEKGQSKITFLTSNCMTSFLVVCLSFVVYFDTV